MRLLIGSPPCTAFSNAGLGAGREMLDELVTAAHAGDWYWGRDDHPMTVWAPLDMGRMVEECEPERIALEQVPPALPIWEAMAYWLRTRGYKVWTGVLNAADFGVPQTRRRAILIASRVGPILPPEPTHAKDPEPGLFGTAEPWVSMASALGWGLAARPGYTFCGGNEGGPDLAGGSGARAQIDAAQERGEWVVRTDNITGVGYDGETPQKYERELDRPAPTMTSRTDLWVVRTRGDSGRSQDDFDPESRPSRALTGKTDSWRLVPGDQPNATVRDADEPAPTIAFGNDVASWRWEPGEEPTHLDRRQQVNGEPVREVPVEEPAPTITGTGVAKSQFLWRDRRNDQSESGEGDPDWPLTRPATTIAGRDLVPDPGANANRFNGLAKSRNDGYRITIQEAAILQSFDPNYPFQGTNTKQFEQVGNAVPPRLAAHVLAAVLGLAPPIFP